LLLIFRVYSEYSLAVQKSMIIIIIYNIKINTIISTLILFSDTKCQQSEAPTVCSVRPRMLMIGVQ